MAGPDALCFLVMFIVWHPPEHVLVCDRVTELVEDLQQRLEKGEVMYVHCWGGRGRAGTVGACLLIKAYGLDAEEALVRVQRAFDTRQDEGRHPGQAQKALPRCHGWTFVAFRRGAGLQSRWRMQEGGRRLLSCVTGT
jgi:hypothetical protein